MQKWLDSFLLKRESRLNEIFRNRKLLEVEEEEVKEYGSSYILNSIVTSLDKLLKKKDKSMGEAHASLSGTKVALTEANESLKIANKIMEDMETYLKEEKVSHVKKVKKLKE